MTPPHVPAAGERPPRDGPALDIVHGPDIADGGRGRARGRAGAGAKPGAERPLRAVLLLHGGRSVSREPSRPGQLAAVRMRPFVRPLVRALPEPGLLVAHVRYRYRGWNGEAADPVDDARRALAELAGLAGGIPVVLVGHSMGGRAALRVAGHPQVRAVVGLAPWWPPGEPVAPLRGRAVLALHGDRDRMTSAGASWDLVRRARELEGTRAGALSVTGGDHAMLRRAGAWHRTTASAVSALLGDPPGQSADPGPIREAFTSEAPVRL